MAALKFNIKFQPTVIQAIKDQGPNLPIRNLLSYFLQHSVRDNQKVQNGNREEVSDKQCAGCRKVRKSSLRSIYCRDVREP